MESPGLDTFSKTGRRWIAFLIIVLTIWGVTDVRKRATFDPANPGKHRTDLTVFTEAGAAFFDGRDPYQVLSPRGWRYPYPPLYAISLAPLSKLPTHWQGMVWFFLNLFLLWRIALECLRLLKLFPDKGTGKAFPAWLGGSALAGVFIPALDCLQRGQTEIVLVFFLLLGVRLIWQNNNALSVFAGGVLLALPVVIKLLPALPVCIILFMGLVAKVFNTSEEAISLKSRWLESLTGVLAGLLLFIWILPGAIVGRQANSKHLQNWYAAVPQKDMVNIYPTSRLRSPRIYRNQSMDNGIYRFGNWIAHQFLGGPPDRVSAWEKLPMDAPRIQSAIRIARGAVLLLLLVLAFRLARHGDALGMVSVFGMACVAALMVSPMSRGQYFFLQLPALLFMPLWFIRRGQTSLARALVFIPVALVFLHYIFLPYAGRIGLLGIGTTLWFVFTAIQMIRLAGNKAVDLQPAPYTETL
jgi:hypothetical protein